MLSPIMTKDIVRCIVIRWAVLLTTKVTKLKQKNVVKFAKKTGISKPKVAVLSGTEDPIESMPSSMEAKEVMEKTINQMTIEQFVQTACYGKISSDIMAAAKKIIQSGGEILRYSDMIKKYPTGKNVMLIG